MASRSPPEVPVSDALPTHPDEDARARAELAADPAIRLFEPTVDPTRGTRLWIVELNRGFVLEDACRTDVVTYEGHYQGTHRVALLFTLRQLAARNPTSASALSAAAPTWLTIDAVADRRGVSRDTVERVLARAPCDLPGSPVDNGTAGRHSWRWRSDGVDGWFAAATAATRPVTPAPSRRRPKRKPLPSSGASGRITGAEVEATGVRKKRG